MSRLLQDVGSVMGCPELVDPLRRSIRVLLVLGADEDAVYLVRGVDDTLNREAFALTARLDVASTELRPKFPQLTCEHVKAAYCMGRGGAFELSAAQHRTLMRSGKFLEAMRAIAKGMFPEEVVQRAIGAEVRLHVNGS